MTRIQFTPNKRQERLLEALLATGLYGRDIPEVVRRLTDEGLQKRFEKLPNSKED